MPKRLIPVILFLIVLTGCSPKTIYTDRLIDRPQMAVPDEPTYFPVQWMMAAIKTEGADTLYCVDSENAKNMLKNHILMREHQAVLRGLIDAMNAPKEK